MSNKSKHSAQTHMHQEEQEEEQTDSDVIRCICDDEEDDGLMIQCDQCLAWQHSICVDINPANIPAEYKCEFCKKKKKRKLSLAKRRGSLVDQDDRHKTKSKNRLKRPISPSSSNDERSHWETNRVSKKKFTQVTKNIVKDKIVKEIYQEIKRHWQQYQKAKDTKEAGGLEPSVQKNLESLVTMASETLQPSIPKASVRPLQRSMRGASFSSQKDPSVQKGIFADIHIPEDRYLLEIVGQVIIKSEYKNNTDNLYSTIFIPLPFVFFHRSLDLCVDARLCGNDARFVRRSCRPNSEIKSIILPNEKEGNLIHLGIFTRKQVERGEEITLGWNWQKNHFVAKKRQEFMKQKEVELDNTMMNHIKNMLDIFKLEYGECACEDKDDCFIEFLKDEIENNQMETKKQQQQKRTQTQKRRKDTISETIQEDTKQDTHQDHDSSNSSSNSINQHHHLKKKLPNTTLLASSPTVVVPDSTTMTPSSSLPSSVSPSVSASVLETPVKTTTTTTQKSTLKSDKTLYYTDSTDEELPKNHTTKVDLVAKQRPSIPPSPAGSVEETDVQHKNVLLPSKLPIKKRWLQSYLNQTSSH